MDKLRRPPSLLQRWTRRRAAARTDDFADYGTAFGLDLTLAASSDDSRSAASQAPASAGWWARWRHRAA